MDWITDKVAIGCYLDAQDAELLRRESIRSVLGLVATLDGKSPTELGLARIEIITLVDGPGNDPSRFARAVDMLTELAAETAPVLVHCRAGWSRSPAVVAGYLIQTQKLTAEKALAEVVSKRGCRVGPELRDMVVEFSKSVAQGADGASAG